MAQIKKLSTELQVKDKLLDTSGDAGTSGQILSSTGTGTNWINAATFSGGTVADATTFSSTTTFNNDIIANGHVYGKAVNNTHSRLYRFGGLYLTWDSDSYGTNSNHSLRSTYGDTFADSITLNSYNHIRFNIDSNNNNSTSYFEVGDGTTSTNNVIFRIDQAGDVTITGDSTTSGDFTIADNKGLMLGTGGDAFFKHTGSAFSFFNDTGHVTFTQRVTDGNIIFKSDNMLGGETEYFRLDGAAGETIFSRNTQHLDQVHAQFGASNDLKIYHDGNNSNYITSTTSDIYLRNEGNNDRIYIQATNSGTIANYITIDGSAGQTKFSKDTKHIDNARGKFGDSNDLSIFHNGSNSYLENTTGDLFLVNYADDKRISFYSDSGTGGTALYFYLDGARSDGTNVATRFPDGSIILLGSGTGWNDGSQIYHNGTNFYLNEYVGNMNFTVHTNDGDIIFSTDDGSGNVTQYFRIDGGASLNVFSKDIFLADGKKALFGSNSDLQIYHSGSHSYIDDAGTGKLILRGNSAIELHKYTGEYMITAVADGAVSLYYDDSKKLETTSAGATVTGDLSVTGDLNITGDINSVSVTDLDVVDKTITLGKGQDEGHSDGSGIVVDGSGASILWDEPNNEWEVNKDLSIYTGAGIATLIVGRNPNERLIIDQTDNETVLTADNDSDADGDHNFRLNRTFEGSGANNFKIQKGGTDQLTIDANANATFAGSVRAEDRFDLYNGAKVLQLKNVNNEFSIRNGNSGVVPLTIDASGNATFAGVLALPDGSASAPSIGNTGDTNTGVYWPGNHQLGFAVNGSRKMYMSETGTFFQNQANGVEINNKLKLNSDGAANSTGAYFELHHENNNSTDVCATINLTNNAGGYAAIVGGTTGANNTGYIEFKTDNAGTQGTVLTLNGDNSATFAGAVSLTGGALSISGDGSNAVTLTESGSGDFTIDAADDIRLDAGGGDVVLKKAGTEYARLTHNNPGLTITTSETNSSMYLWPNGTGNVYALTDTFIVTSAEGEAAKILLRTDESDDNGDDWYITNETNNNLEFTNDRTGSQLANLTLTPQSPSSSAIATFAGNVDIGATLDVLGTGTSTFGGKVEVQNNTLQVRDTSSNKQIRIQASVSNNARIQTHDTNTGNDQNLDIEALQIDLKTGSISGSANASTLLLDSSKNATFAGDVTINGSHLVLANGTTYAQATDYLYIGGSGLDSADGAIYLGNRGDGNSYGWRFIYKGSGSGNANNLVIQSENATNPVDALTFNQNGVATFASNATFAGQIDVNGAVSTFGAAGTGTGDAVVSIDGGSGTGGEAYLRLTRGGTSGFILNHTASAIQVRATANIPMYFYTNDTVALTLNTSQNATFTGNVTIGSTSIAATRSLTIQTNSEQNSVINLKEANANYGFSLVYDGTANDFIIKRHDNSAGGINVLTLNRTDNNATFAGRVGVGVTASTNAMLDVKGPDTDNAVLGRFWSNTGARGSFIIRNGSGTNPTTFIGTAGGSEQLSIGTNNNEAIRIDAQSAPNATFAGDVSLPDNKKVILGTSDDLQIYHNSSNDRGYIYNATGDLYIENDATDGDIKFFSDDGSGGTTEYFRLDGGTNTVEIYKYTRFQDTARFTSNATFDTNSKAKFGDDGDLQIYHSGSHSYISAVGGTGSLYIRPGNGGTVQIEDNSSNDMITASASAVSLYHSGSEKLATRSYGIGVTGVVSNRSIPCLFNSNFEDAYGTSIVVVPFNNNTENNVSSRTYNHNLTMPYAGKLTKIVMKHVSGTLSSGFTTQLFLYVNGSQQASSSEISLSSSSVTWTPTTNNTFSAGDVLSFAYQKSAIKTFGGVSFGVAIELTDYDI